MKVKIQELTLLAVNTALQAMQKEIEQLKTQVKALQAAQKSSETNIQEE